MAKPAAGGLTWRVIFDEARPGAMNMAFDHALTTSPRRGEGVLRLYSWASPAVSFGRHEPASGAYDAEAGKASGIGFVRRPTGGRAVYHDAELTYAVVLPDRTSGGPKGVYSKINEGLALGLKQLGVDASVAGAGAVLAPDAGPCFQVSAPGEILAGGQKLVGSAQVRIGSSLLQHGSIILDGDQSQLSSRCLGAGPIQAPASLRALIGEVSTWDLAEALTGGLEASLGGVWEEGEYRSGEIEEAEWLEKERYGSEEWTWRQ